MFARFRYKQRRFVVDLVHSRRVDGKPRTVFCARLGSVALPEPIALPERRAFWTQLAARLAAIEARRPGCISATVKRKALASIEARIPRPIDTEKVSVARKHATRTRQPEPA